MDKKGNNLNVFNFLLNFLKNIVTITFTIAGKYFDK